MPAIPIGLAASLIAALAILSSPCLAATPNPEPQVEAVKGLLTRRVSAVADRFEPELIPQQNGLDVFEVESGGAKIKLRGSTGVAMAAGFNWYLQQVCERQMTWCGSRLDLQPGDLKPVPGGKFRNVLPFQHTVYLNYCTFSYSMAWWDWERWQWEIDYMAMNGINMPLAVTGLEGVWYETLRQFNFSDAEAREFLVGPAYFAWEWMQNLERYGGPLPQSWIDSHVELGRKILERERAFGMTPIQQGFSGAVPRRLKDKFPNAEMKQQPMWLRSFEGTMQLDPLDPLFQKFGRAFLENQKRLFGTSHYYGADPFHESAPPKPGADYLSQVGQSITALLTNFDSQATWCMQSWSIRKDLATAVPKERLLVLDIGGRWRGSEQFWGYPFVVGTIHNFGGRTRMFGNLDGLAKNPFAQAKATATNCVGMGIFPEAIENNPVYFALAFDSTWRTNAVDTDTWLRDYARRRYGANSTNATEAWQILHETVYRSGGLNSSLLAARPALEHPKADPNWGLGMPYEPGRVVEAWTKLLTDADRLKTSPGYCFDVVDLGRQILGDLAQPLHWEVAAAFMDRDTNHFAAASQEFLELFTDADRLCGSEPLLSFNHWQRCAQAWAKDEEEKRLYTFNASMLVTHWGGDTTPRIFDYSWHEWGGLIDGYYRQRWAQFHEHLAQLLARGQTWTEKGLPDDYGRPKLQSNDFYRNLYAWEMNWIQAPKSCPTDSQGDSVEIARQLLAKYQPLFAKHFSPAGRERWAQMEAHVQNPAPVKHTGEAVWRWKPRSVGTAWKKVSFDITTALHDASEFNLEFLYERGSNRLEMKDVVLLQNDAPLARDDHSGRTGNEHVNNVYHFTIPMAVPNARYSIRASVRTSGGDNSTGAVWLTQVE